MLNQTNEPVLTPVRRTAGFAAACIAALALGLGGGATAQATEPATQPPAVVAPDGSATTAPEATPTPKAEAPKAGGDSATTAEGAAPAGDAQAKLVGLPVITSDGQRVGDVEQIVSGNDGTLKEVLIKTGGFLGFGGKRVAIPVEKIAEQDKTVRLTLTAKEVGALPEAPQQSG